MISRAYARAGPRACIGPRRYVDAAYGGYDFAIRMLEYTTGAAL